MYEDEFELEYRILGEYTYLLNYDGNLTDYLLRERENEHVDQNLKRLLIILDLYVLPALVLIGFIGNSLSFAVFMGSYLRRYSPNIYLAALAFSDNVFLLSIFLSWISTIGIDVYNKDGGCQTLAYLTYVTAFLSVWYVVAFSVERYIAVCFPLRRQEMCTTSRARLVVIGFAVLALLLYTFSTITLGITNYEGRPMCAPLPIYNKYVSTLNNLDTLLTFVIPMVVIIVCNVRITYKVMCFYKQRLVIVSSPQVIHRHPHRHHNWRKVPIRSTIPRNHSAQAQIRVTKMLLLVSSVFLLLNLPSHTIRTHIIIMTFIDKSYIPSTNYMLWHKLFQFVYYMNFSVNIFLYNLSGRTFRRGLQRLIRRVHRHLKDVAQSIGSTREETPFSRQRGKTVRSYDIPLENRMTTEKFQNRH